MIPLLPAPRRIITTQGTFTLPPGQLILMEAETPQVLLPAVRRFQGALEDALALQWEAVASPANPKELTGLHLRIDREMPLHPQGYKLFITPEEMRVEAATAAGVFYGVCTLIQLLQVHGSQLPCLEISDWPDFPARGVLLDISRDKVPTLETLFTLVDLLAGWKINQLQLYTEHTFAYRQHPEVWANASPLTGQEIMLLDQYCQERFIELVPNQNSFGHLHRWLGHPRYKPLAEVQEGFEAPWGRVEGTNSLCPTDPRSLDLVRSLYDELLPHFTSRMFNVGCDETFDLGQGRSREICAQEGQGRVYLDFLLKIYREVSIRGRTMQYWGDIVIQHPDLISSLPEDAIALEWGYEADHPFDAHGALFAAAGLPFYVCPGTSSWSSIAGRSDNALGNLLNAAENGLKHGAGGYLITDWGDNGHWQTLPVSYLGFAAGAAYSWCLQENRSLDLPQALDRFAFRDRAGVMGCLAYNLGNVYQAANIVWLNASPLFSILQRPFAQLSDHPKIRAIPYERVQGAVYEVISNLTQANMARPDSALILREFNLAARMLDHACRRGRLVVGGYTSDAAQVRRNLDLDMEAILCDYEQVWLERSRPGGLPESLAKLARTRRDYLEFS